MRLVVLGTPAVVVDGRLQPVTGPLQRLLLALLACRAGEWTSADTLAEALWPGEYAGRVGSRLQLHVHRLRARLGAESVLSGPGGYRLGLDVEDVDAWAFDSLVSGSLDAHRRRPSGADVLVPLEEGLALWGGRPFAGLEHPDLDAERQRLTELYVLGQETRIQHHLDRGQHETARAVALPLAKEHPFRERLQSLSMTALHRAGDRAAALEVFRDTRRRLVGELGIEPGSELQGVHELVLAGAPVGVSPAAVGPGAASASGAPSAPDPGTAPGATAPSGTHDLVRQLCGAGRYLEAEEVLRAAIEHEPAPRAVAAMRRELAVIVSTTGRQGEALALQSRAEAYFRQHHEAADHAALLDEMAVVCGVTGDLHRSLRVLEEADELRREAGIDHTHGDVVRALILVHMRRLVEADRLLADVDEASVGDGTAVTLARARSQLHRRRGEHEAGVAWAHRAVDAAHRRTEFRAPLGLALVDLACCLRDAQDPGCFDVYTEALRLARGGGGEPMAAMAHASLAKAWLDREDPGRATVHAQEALRLAMRCECFGFAARANTRLGDAAHALGEPIRAGWYWWEALACWRRVDYPVPAEERDRVEGLVTDA